jgi:predicted ester cyclase
MLPGPIGGDDLARYVESLAEAFPDVAFESEDIIVRGDRAVLQWRMTGTNTGPLPEFPGPTGRAVDLPGADIIDIGPDGIVRIVGYFDQVTFFRQLGVELQPASAT